MLHISALALHSNRARAQLNRALAQLFQPSQGWLSVARPSAAWSDHTSQMNEALGVKRTRVRLRMPSVSTHVLYYPASHTHTHTSLHLPALALPHQVLSRAALCCVVSRDRAGLYSEGAC